MSAFLYLATAAALGCGAIHVVIGGKRILRPLLASAELSRHQKLLFHYMWHLITILILGLALSYGHAVLFGGRDIAVAATSVAAVCSLWTLLFIATQGGSLRRFPQWALFGAIAALGLMGVV